ncbi:hypothetical protein MRB53_038435 [Persea americana]|nr:hypothetical protein MRB53_038435 [Persea americana]
MKQFTLLQLATASVAFVIPNEEVMANVQIEDTTRQPSGHRKVLPSIHEVEVIDRVKSGAHNIGEAFSRVASISHQAIDDAIEYATEVGEEVQANIYDTYFDAKGWLEDSASQQSAHTFGFDIFDAAQKDDSNDDVLINELAKSLPRPSHAEEQSPKHKGCGSHKKSKGFFAAVIERFRPFKADEAKEHDHPHHGRGKGPHGRPPHHGPPPPHRGPPHHKKPHHGRPHHNHTVTKTVYELIAGSKYTTKLAKLISEFPDLVEALNGTAANFTVFAPTDKAFEKIPKHHPKPSKEQLKALLSYHVSPDFYPAGRILVTRTIPSLLKSAELADPALPQRLTTNIGLRGLTINFYSKVVAANIFGTNGVIHGVDSIIIPPPSVLKIVDLLPGEFSTLSLGLAKTGLLEGLNTTHLGGTFFAPSNFAFRKLGPRANAFLFSSYGAKYLKALLEYHVVPNATLYSDAYYKSDGTAIEAPRGRRGRGVPKGLFHFDLPTLLGDRSLSIDIARYGRLFEIKINGFYRVAVSDGVARDGVLHVMSSVIIPPKTPGGFVGEDDAEDISVEDLKERLAPFVEADASDKGEWTTEAAEHESL